MKIDIDSLETKVWPNRVKKFKLHCLACNAETWRTKDQILKLDPLTPGVYCDEHKNLRKKPRRGETKVCLTCGNEFYVRPSGVEQEHCSISCGKIGKPWNGKRLQEKNCSICNSEFMPKTQSQSTCGAKDCVTAARLKKMDTQPITFTCLECGKSETRRPSRMPSELFCSRQCKNTNYKKTSRIIGNCPNCGELTDLTIKKTCGTKCANEMKRKHFIDPDKLGRERKLNSNGYIIIKIPGHPLADSLGWVSEHRLKVYERDGDINPALDVHHKDENKTNNSLENLELITVAEHQKEHQNGRIAAQKDVVELESKVSDLQAEINRLTQLLNT